MPGKRPLVPGTLQEPGVGGSDFLPVASLTSSFCPYTRRPHGKERIWQGRGGCLQSGAMGAYLKPEWGASGIGAWWEGCLKTLANSWVTTPTPHCKKRQLLMARG